MDNASSDRDVLVVIPTYNERENIPRLVEAINKADSRADILIVDDNSPDGTGQAAEDAAKSNPTVNVMHRTGKEGRGSACIAGFKEGLKSPQYNLFIEMDADFSHDPVALPELLKEAETADIVIGSRYLPGSKIVHWGWKRTFFSRWANRYARAILHIPISDYTNGYRVYSRELLETVDLDKIKQSGYIVLSEIAYQAKRHGFKFGEVPITFVNRVRGESNLSFHEIFSAFTGVVKIRFRK
jgi:glycosyltransferase involved in cell wall biosynthesis